MRYKPGVKEAELDKQLLMQLRLAEVFSRREFVITSGMREGDDRCHGTAQAVDIACVNSNDRMRIVWGLVRAGIARVGVYSAHIHADICVEGYPQGVLWLGGASK